MKCFDFFDLVMVFGLLIFVIFGSYQSLSVYLLEVSIALFLFAIAYPIREILLRKGIR